MHTRYEPVWVNFHPHDHIVTIYGIVTMYHLPQYRKWVLQEEIWWSPDNTDKDVPDVPLQAEIQSRSVLWCTLQFTIFSLSSSFSWRCVPIIAHSLRSEIAEKIFHSGYSNFLFLSLSLSLSLYISVLDWKLSFVSDLVLSCDVEGPSCYTRRTAIFWTVESIAIYSS